MPGIHKKKPIKRAMGGEAAESVRKATIRQEETKKRRKAVDESINRVYSKVAENKRLPKLKKKPKNPNRIKPKKKPKKPVVVGVSGALKGFAQAFKPKKPTKVKVPKIVKDLRALGGIKNVSSDSIKAAIKAMKGKK